MRILEVRSFGPSFYLRSPGLESQAALVAWRRRARIRGSS